MKFDSIYKSYGFYFYQFHVILAENTFLKVIYMVDLSILYMKTMP